MPGVVQVSLNVRTVSNLSHGFVDPRILCAHISNTFNVILGRLSAGGHDVQS